VQNVRQIKEDASEEASANENDAMTRPEETIDQVRDLLFGTAQRSLESRLIGLREEMQASFDELKAEFRKELATLQAMVEELEKSSENKQLASHREIGAAISQLGATISELGSRRTGK
jgi:hypothetical protein